jgi:ribulose-5-phosphate 4-epimerase/fuculose-1-phosphate aldolase
MQNVSAVSSFVKFKDVKVGSTEAEIRVDLAACYRLVFLHGMSDLAANHITARVPGTADRFFINPYGMVYDEITASSLNKVDLDGNIVQQGSTAYGVNTAGYIIHSAIHAARHDVACVLHTHTRAGVAVSAMADGLLPITQTALQLYDQVAYHEYEGPATSLDERARLAANLGSRNCLVLRNHGLLTCGRTIAEAFFYMYLLDSACKIQVDLLASGARIQFPSSDSVEAAGNLMRNIRAVPRGNLEWASLRRRLDRALPGYEL